MPSPDELQAFIRDPRFQTLGVADQHARLRGYLHESDPEFGGFQAPEQQQLVSGLIDYHKPTLATTIADVAEYVPVVGGAVRGARGEPVRPLTRLVSGGYEAPAGAPRAFQEAGRDVAELAAIGGATALLRPFLGRVAARVAGGVAEDVAPGLLGSLAQRTGASTLVDAALKATTSAGAEKLAGTAAKAALRQRFVERGLTELTVGELFGITNAIERGISSGEFEPFEDFVKTPLGVAALGTAFYGLGGVVRKLGIRNAQSVVDDLAARDPARLAGLQQDAGRVVEAVARTSGGKLNREAAADVVFNAVRAPIAEAGDIALLKQTLRSHPEILDSELGLRLLRTQRARLTAPDVRTTASPGLRVTYDDEAGRTVTEVINDVGAQKAFARRVQAGRIVVDNAAGDEASILRSGVRAGTVLEERVAPGGGPVRLRPEGEAVVAGTPSKFFETQLPALRQENVELSDDLVRAASELRPKTSEQFAREPLQITADLSVDPNATFGVYPNGDIVRLRPVTLAPPPAVGTDVSVTRANTKVRIVEEADPVGRVVVDLGNGRRVRAQWMGRTATVDVPLDLLDLPSRPPILPQITTSLGEVLAPGFQRLGAVVTAKAEVRAQIRPGQVIHQMVRDVERRGVRPSVEILTVDGERVMFRSGETTMEASIDDFAETIEKGIGKFAFDMTAKGEAMLESQAARFNERLREGPIIGDPKQSAAAHARDVQLADELFSFDRSHGQRAGPSTLARDSGEGLARKTKERQNRPAEERTKGGNPLVKGCKK